MAEVSVFQENIDRYSGIRVDTKDLKLTVPEFEDALKASLKQWKNSQKRGVWFKVQLCQSNYVPLLAQQGFDFHHAKEGYVMMTKWLPADEPVALPHYPYTYIGASGLVVSDKNEILVVKEKYHPEKLWKIPGGNANPGEDFADTARREVMEETGIETEFQSIVVFRHHHNKHNSEYSRLSVICLMKPKNTNINECPYEIAEAKWMKLEEFKSSHQDTNPFSRTLVQVLEDNQRLGVCIGCTKFFSDITNELQNIYHVKRTTEC